MSSPTTLKAALAQPEIMVLAVALGATIAGSAGMALYTLSHPELGLTKKRTFMWRDTPQDQNLKLYSPNAYSPTALEHHRTGSGVAFNEKNFV